MKTAIISVTNHGAQIGQTLRVQYAKETPEDTVVCYEKQGKTSGQPAHAFTSMKEIIGDIFTSYDRILCLMATGIVVRMIAPYIVHKSKDPAVLVMDEQATFVISLLSGHLGGANEWTQEIAAMTGATPVITTATDVNGLVAPDVIARQLQLAVENFTALKTVNAAIVDRKPVTYLLDATLPWAADYEAHLVKAGVTMRYFHPERWGDNGSPMVQVDGQYSGYDWSGLQVIITDRVLTVGGMNLWLRPKTMTMGIGCRRDTPVELIRMAIQESLANVGRSPLSVLGAASVIIKADEQGLLDAVREMGWPIHFYTQEEMAPQIAAQSLNESDFVKQTIGVGNVCETTALMLAQSQQLLQQKTIFQRTTVAIAQVAFKSSALAQVMQNL